VRRYETVVSHVVRETARGHADTEDLRQAARLGLAKAIARYDVARGMSLRAYAVPTMRGEVLRHLRDHTWGIRPPRRLQERAIAIVHTAEALSSRGRATAQDVADVLGLTLEEVLEGLEARASRTLASLDTPSQDLDDETRTIGDEVGAIDRGFQGVEESAALGEAMSELSSRDALVMQLRYVDALTQTQVAGRLGVSQMQVSRIERQAIARLRELATASGSR